MSDDVQKSILTDCFKEIYGTPILLPKILEKKIPKTLTAFLYFKHLFTLFDVISETVLIDLDCKSSLPVDLF